MDISLVEDPIERQGITMIENIRLSMDSMQQLTRLRYRGMTPYPRPLYMSLRIPLKRVSDIIISDAIRNKLLCSISMEPITEDSVCVSPCYHVFNKESIDTWLKTSTTCPDCRNVCFR